MFSSDFFSVYAAQAPHTRSAANAAVAVLAARMKILPRDCIDHIFGYTYKPQPLPLLEQIREQNTKMHLFDTYLERAQHLAEQGASFSQNHLYVLMDDYMNIFAHLKNVNTKKYFKSYRNKLIYVFRNLDIKQIHEFLESFDHLLLISWYYDHARLPPFPWMYEDEEPVGGTLTAHYLELARQYSSVPVNIAQIENMMMD